MDNSALSGAAALSIMLNNPTGRSTEARVLRLGPGLTLYFSYSTLIGVSGPLGAVRCTNTWGPTTGRHMNEMGLRSNRWDEVNEEALLAHLSEELIRLGLELLPKHARSPLAMASLLHELYGDEA